MADGVHNGLAHADVGWPDDPGPVHVGVCGDDDLVVATAIPVLTGALQGDCDCCVAHGVVQGVQHQAVGELPACHTLTLNVTLRFENAHVCIPLSVCYAVTAAKEQPGSRSAHQVLNASSVVIVEAMYCGPDARREQAHTGRAGSKQRHVVMPGLCPGRLVSSCLRQQRCASATTLSDVAALQNIGDANTLPCWLLLSPPSGQPRS